MPSENSDEPATRDDLKKLNARLDARIDKLDQKIDRVAMDLVKTRKEIATKADAAEMHKRFDQIMHPLDSISGQMIDQSRTVVIWDKILKEYRIQLNDHENRLTALEQ